MDNEANARYRDNMEAGSYMVLWNPKRGRGKAEVTSEPDAVRAAPASYKPRNRT